MRKYLILSAMGFSSLFAANYDMWESGSNQGCPACRRASTYRNRQQQNQMYSNNQWQANENQNVRYQGNPNQTPWEGSNMNHQNYRNQGYVPAPNQRNLNTPTQWDTSRTQHLTPKEAYYQENTNRRNYQNSSYNNSQTNNNQDQIIHNKIREFFNNGILTQEFANVIFSVKDGSVTLRGSVLTNSDKNRLEQKVRNLDGVKSVNNQLEVEQKTAYVPSPAINEALQNDFGTTDYDKKLNKRIRDTLTTTVSKSYNNISFNTTRGVVTISGNIETSQERDQLIARIRNVDGVRAIINQMGVNNKSVS